MLCPLQQIGQEGSPTSKKTHLSEDDPLGALDELAKIISDASMIVHWDSTTFGSEAQIPLYLNQQDVREFASGRKEINITLIQLWMIKKGFNDVYGFIDPSMTHERNKFDDIQTYITTCFGMGNEIYFLPYILGPFLTFSATIFLSRATIFPHYYRCRWRVPPLLLESATAVVGERHHCRGRTTRSATAVVEDRHRCRWRASLLPLGSATVAMGERHHCRGKTTVVGEPCGVVLPSRC
ncbi:hypothetical protein LR48_Vigan272s001600 [Vigna angularis]|uniref:Uncharacterized protein n=1 Tax=Phaseolus angularis TaxID=3914 RepID=A0A0L9T770_PHAAN|nr:hypothetical protein LR48_Vigan272s001600 [Vigna angularis]